MNFSNLSIRRLCGAALIALLVITILWWALWTLAASRYRTVIDGWIELQRAAGYQVTFDDRSLFGFPRHVVLRFTNLNWRSNDGITFHADDIDISATPWQWKKFTAKFKHHAEIDTPLDEENRALVLAGEDGSARVELTEDGTWKFSRVILNRAKLGRSPDYLMNANYLSATAERPEIPPHDHTQVGLDLSGEAKTVILPEAMGSPFGTKMADLAVHMSVMGTVPDVRRRDSVEAWNKESGVVEFDNLHMEWGPLTMTTKGTMGFDDDLQPEGAFSGSISGQKEVLKALMDKGFIAQRQEAMLDSALTLFAKPSSLAGTSGIEVPITVQLGGLFLGPVRIFTFPEIEWPVAPPMPVPATP